MTKTEALELAFDKIKVAKVLAMMSSLEHWDAATLGVPEKSIEARGMAAGWVQGESFKRFIAPDIEGRSSPNKTAAMGEKS